MISPDVNVEVVVGVCVYVGDGLDVVVNLGVVVGLCNGFVVVDIDVDVHCAAVDLCTDVVVGVHVVVGICVVGVFMICRCCCGWC